MLSTDLSSLVTFHRKKAGLSQTDLARHAGLSRFVIQDIEGARDRTTWRNLLSVLAVLNIRLEPVGPLVAEWRASRTSKPDNP